MSVQCISRAIAYDAPSPTAKLVLLILANYADENGQCFPPVKRIVADTGLSERGVRGAIKALMDCGAVSKAARRRKDGTQTSDLFTLFHGAKEQTAPRAPSQPAPDAACDDDSLHHVPVQPAPRAPLTSFEPSLEPSLAAVVVREPANDAVPADDWPDGDARRHAEMLSAEAGTIRLDPSRQPGLATTMGRIHAWRRDGASWDHDVRPVVVSIAQKAGSPIGSWKFFDSAIAQSIADNRQALTIPEAQNATAAHDFQPGAKLREKRANHARHVAGAEQAARVLADRRAY